MKVEYELNICDVVLLGLEPKSHTLTGLEC